MSCEGDKKQCKENDRRGKVSVHQNVLGSPIRDPGPRKQKHFRRTHGCKQMTRGTEHPSSQAVDQQGTLIVIMERGLTRHPCCGKRQDTENVPVA